ncbi:MAG: PKD domain-containing protein [Pseudomonadota bacterium]
MMKNLIRMLVTCIGVISLVACGGSSGGGGVKANSSAQSSLIDAGAGGGSSVKTNSSTQSSLIDVGVGADADADGLPDTTDTDDDGDGVLDVQDAFPLDNSESANFDGDGIGDNADVDDDNDGVLDDKDDLKSLVKDLTSSLSSTTEYVFDTTRNYVYISNKSDFSLSVLNVQTGDVVTTIKFPKMPESLFLSQDKSKLYVALLEQEHNSYLFDAQSGAVGIIDLDTLSLSKTLTINTDPYDLVVTKSGKLIVTSGSGQWTNIYAYDASTGAELGHANIRQMSHLTLHPSEDWVFTTDTDSSPSDMNKYDIRGVGITYVADSPYHGDHRISGEVWATPDGKYLIAKGGDIFLASDMTYVSSITAGYDALKHVSFDPLGNVALVTLANNSVLTLNSASLEPIKTLKTFGSVNFTAQSDKFVYIFVTSGGVTSLLTQEPPCDCANNNAPQALFTFTPSILDTSKTITFDASTSSDPDGDSLSYRWDINSDGVWDTIFSTNPKYEKRFAIPGVRYIRLQVKDVNGMVSTQTQLIDISQGVDAGVVVLDSVPNILNFSINNVVTDKINSKLYISDKNTKRIYVVDIVTGLTEKYFTFEGVPESLSLSLDGSKLIVALLSKDHNAYYWNEEKLSYIAVINTNTQTYVNTFVIKKDIYSVVGINNDRVIVIGNSNQSSDIQIYDLSTGQIVGNSAYTSATGRMAVNSTGTIIFFVDSYIKKYDVSGATPSLINQYDSSVNYRVGTRVWPTPDGKYLITQGGDIVTTSDLKLAITKTSVNVTINDVAFDAVNQIAILTLSDGSVDVINLLSLESIKKITSLGTVSNSIVGNNLYMVSTLVGFSNIVKLDHPCLDCATNKPPVAAFTYTPLGGNTGSTYQFNAATSSDPENNSLSYRWDLNGDGVWDSSFTSTAIASRKYIIAGTKNIRLQVKDSKGLTTILSGSFAVAQGIDNGVAVTDSIANQFNFKVTDSVTDTVRGKLYVSDKVAKRLYVVDVLTGLVEKYFEFEYMPENMALSVDGTKLYLALLVQEHSSYWWDEQQAGYVGVIDLASAAYVNTLAINVDPYDLALTTDNHLVVSAGSGQWTTFHIYDATNGQQITEFAQVYERTRFVLDATTNIAYFIDSGVKKVDIIGAEHTQSSSSTNESVGNNLWLSPDRKYVITQGGVLFNASDLSVVKRLTISGITIESVTFDIQAQVAFLSLSSGYVQTINLLSQESIAQTKITGVPGNTVVLNSSLYILNTTSTNVALIKQDHPCPACATNKAPTAKFALIASTGNTADTYQFNASSSTDPEASILFYRWDIDGDNIWDTDWASSALKSYKFLLPGNKLVRVQVKDPQGAVSSYSQAFSVAQGVDLGTAVIDSTAFRLNLTATDVIKDANNAKLYVSDKSAKRVYIVDLTTGLTEKYFDFQFGPERMALSTDGKFIYVSLPVAEHSSYVWAEDQSGYIGVIDISLQAYVKTFPVTIDPYDLVMSKDNRLVVSSGSGQWTEINSYDASTGELLGGSTIYQNALLAAHPTNGWVFAMDTGLSPSDVHKYDTQGANLQSLGDSPYHGDHRIYGDIWITPDGKYLITGGGDILLTSDMTYVRGLTTTNLSIKTLAFDPTNNLLVVVNSNLDLVSYDLTTLMQKSVIKAGVSDPKIIYIFNGSVYLMHNSAGSQVIDKVLIP